MVNISDMTAEVPDRQLLAQRLSDARAELERNMARVQEIRSALTASRDKWDTGRTTRESIHDSAYAHLLARFESQPVIEQAKGVLMASTPCDADTAFDILRRASQRENIPLREVAARIVQRASGEPAWEQPA
jgi:hypothetical protein